MKNSISIIIVTFQAEPFIEACLESILNQTDSCFNVVIVDNNSSDRTKFLIKEYQKEHPRIHLLENHANLGFSRANNIGIRYARERTQFGRPIGKFQLIQAKIGTMATQLEASKLLTYNATRMIDRGIPCLKEASMAKYFATEAACTAADECTRILGAYGYSAEYNAQRYYRDNRFLLYGGGTHEILQTNIARWSGL